MKESDKKDAYEISSTLWWRSGVEGRTIEQEVLEARLFNLFQIISFPYVSFKSKIFVLVVSPIVV